MEIKSLEEAKQFLNEIPYINRGGCGISALSLYRWIKKNQEDKNVKFVFLYTSKTDYLNNENVLKNKTGKAESPSHAVLLYDGHFVDSHEDITFSDLSDDGFRWLQIIEEEEFIKQSIKNKDSWNSSFDRENIQKIEENLKIDLSDIK